MFSELDVQVPINGTVWTWQARIELTVLQRGFAFWLFVVWEPTSFEPWWDTFSASGSLCFSCQCEFQLNPCACSKRCRLQEQILFFHSRPVSDADSKRRFCSSTQGQCRDTRASSLLFGFWLCFCSSSPWGHDYRHLTMQVGTFFLKSTWSKGTLAAQRVHSIQCKGTHIFPYLSCVESLQLCPTLCDPVDCSPPDSSVHRTLQARILEWVVISFSRGSSRTRDWTLVSCIGRWVLYH